MKKTHTIIIAPETNEGNNCPFSRLRDLNAEEMRPKIPTVPATFQKLRPNKHDGASVMSSLPSVIRTHQNRISPAISIPPM